MKWVVAFIAFCMAGGLLLSSCGGGSKPAGPVTFDWDKADVTSAEAAIAKYPQQYQDTYNQIVKVKCTACHPVARVLYAPYYDSDTWTKIVNKMQSRPGSQVTAADVPKVLQFVEYDHQQRKADIDKMFADQHWQQKPPVLP